MDQLPFIPNRFYNRRADIHAQYGGNWQSGICPSLTFLISLFFPVKQDISTVTKMGDNPNVFYTGEGQAGDMRFTKGNLAWGITFPEWKAGISFSRQKAKDLGIYLTR